MLQQSRTLYEPAIRHDTMKVGFSMLPLLSILMACIVIPANLQMNLEQEKAVQNRDETEDEY